MQFASNTSCGPLLNTRTLVYAHSLPLPLLIFTPSSHPSPCTLCVLFHQHVISLTQYCFNITRQRTAPSSRAVPSCNREVFACTSILEVMSQNYIGYSPCSISPFSMYGVRKRGCPGSAEPFTLAPSPKMALCLRN